MYRIVSEHKQKTSFVLEMVMLSPIWIIYSSFYKYLVARRHSTVGLRLSQVLGQKVTLTISTHGTVCSEADLGLTSLIALSVLLASKPEAAGRRVGDEVSGWRVLWWMWGELWELCKYHQPCCLPRVTPLHQPGICPIPGSSHHGNRDFSRYQTF